MKDLDQHKIKQEAPILFNIKRGNNLEVPKGYFKELPKELLKITEKQEKTVSINKKWGAIISIAAIVLIGLFILKPNQTTIKSDVIAYNDSFNNLTAEDFEALLLLEDEDYLTNDIDFDDAEELQFFASELQKPLLSIEVTEEDFDNYFESEIEDYYY